MFDNISAIGWAFGSLLLVVGGFVAAGVFVRNSRERRYLKVANEKS